MKTVRLSFEQLSPGQQEVIVETNCNLNRTVQPDNQRGVRVSIRKHRVDRVTDPAAPFYDIAYFERDRVISRGRGRYIFSYLEVQ